MRPSICLSEERIILANDAMADMLGWTADLFINKDIRHFVAEPDGSELLTRAQLGKPAHPSRALLRKRDGSLLPANYSSLTLRPQSGKACQVITFKPLEPMPERKTLSFQHIFECSMFGIVYADIDNHILEANSTFLDMLGYELEDFTSGGLGWKAITPEEWIPLNRTAIQQLKESGSFTPFEEQLIHKNGSLVDVLVGGMLDEGSFNRVFAFVIDITAKKSAERALIEGEMLFRTMAEGAPMPVWYHNSESKLIYTNGKMLEYTGAGSLEKQLSDGWEPYLHPDDVPPAHALLQEAFEAKKFFEIESRVYCAATDAYRWNLATGRPAFSQQGEFLGYIGAMIDIHDRKIAQETLVNYAQRLEQSNQELEHFATIASHDLQEPLRKVRLFSDHLRQVTQEKLDSEALDDLDRIQRATQKMQRLIEDLLDLSRVVRRGIPFRKVDLKALTEEVVAELRHTFPDIHRQVELQGGMWIDADPKQVRQMMNQLLDNAMKFHQPGRAAQVKITIQSLDPDQCLISVSDNGIGIKQEHLGKIFDTFVRLHHGQDFSGTGIGLSLVKKIVERHTGSITVESTPDEGTTFHITLPISQTEHTV